MTNRNLSVATSLIIEKLIQNNISAIDAYSITLGLLEGTIEGIFSDDAAKTNNIIKLLNSVSDELLNYIKES